MNFKLGKGPATKDVRDLKFSLYRTKLPVLPKEFGHENLVKIWGMLGNDEVGDCVFAGAAHETMLWTAAGGKPAAFNTTNALADYSAVTGYDPKDPSTDQGATVRQALNYRRRTGVIDNKKKRHKIEGYMSIDYKDVDDVKMALYLLGAIGVGIQFPNSAMDQFNRNQVWTVVKGATIEGGHYIPIVAYRRGMLYCVTWGRVQAMTMSFFRQYCDEAWAILSTEMLRAGKTLEGFNLAQLKADLAAL